MRRPITLFVLMAILPLVMACAERYRMLAPPSFVSNLAPIQIDTHSSLQREFEGDLQSILRELRIESDGCRAMPTVGCDRLESRGREVWSAAERTALVLSTVLPTTDKRAALQNFRANIDSIMRQTAPD
jgi:hypothetical protein